MPFAHAAGIVADGGTATSVTSNASGRQTVTLAPSVSGVSNNTYNSFNVGAAGADLNNVGVNARTIVNQVTSTSPSVISGDITVLGSRANVVLANPNGITINGGSFVNTGRVALSTGQVSFDDVTIAPGVTQRNIVLNTSTGTIVVGPQGLASALIGLDLIAKNIVVNGPLNNTFTSSTAMLRAIGGTSSVTLNTGLSPTDNANDWLSLQASSAPARSTSFAIDITAAGSLVSGRVELIATDAGLGVRSAGPLNASLGNFTLSSAGAVVFANSTVTAANTIDIQGGDAISAASMQFKSDTATVKAGAALSFAGTSVLATNGIDLSGANIQLNADGNAASTVASTNSGVVLTSTGNISNIGALIQGQQRNTSDASSLGAVTVNAGGDVLNRSLPGSTLGILFGVGGDVSITAGGSITNENARVLSNQGVTLTATGDINNQIDHSTGVDNGAPVRYSDQGKRFLFIPNNSDGVNVDYGVLSDSTQLAYITADSGNVSITGQNINNVGGSILSNGGNISLSARDALTTQAVFAGTASYQQSCFIFCKAHASSTVQGYGGVIEAANNISLQAGNQIANIGGTVLAVNQLTLTAPHTLAEAMLGYTAFNSTHDLKAWFGNAWAAIYASDTGGIFTGGTGQVDVAGEADINGGAFNAPSGVKASGGVVTIQAPHQDPMTIGKHNHVGLISWFGL